jgi:hypothetical protein
MNNSNMMISARFVALASSRQRAAKDGGATHELENYSRRQLG